MSVIEETVTALWKRGLNTYDIAADIAKRWNMALHESHVCRMLYQKNGAGAEARPRDADVSTHQLGEANESNAH